MTTPPSTSTPEARTEKTRSVIERMVEGLNQHRIDDIGEFFSDDFIWDGNFGCGKKHGIKAFQEGWQRPFQVAFSGKFCVDEARIVQGEWAAAFGRQEAIHGGELLGMEATGKPVTIRYMDFWRVSDGHIVHNPVFVDFADVLKQLGSSVYAVADAATEKIQQLKFDTPVTSADIRDVRTQAVLTQNNDPIHTSNSLRLIQDFIQTLNQNGNIRDYLADSFVYQGNEGVGIWQGADAYLQEWYQPFCQAFTDRHYQYQQILAEGEWVAAFGQIDAVLTGEFMGHSSEQNQLLQIPVMEFWQVKQQKIVAAWGNIDLGQLFAQLGTDVFGGKGWESKN